MSEYLTLWRKQEPWMYWICVVMLPWSIIRLVVAMTAHDISDQDVTQLFIWMLVSSQSMQIAHLKVESENWRRVVRGLR